ncbi:saccharopine dehydrogenase NADP-binding domain-containing protein [Aureimonas altamirensis]|uniref:saccharopine dehydrogenase family protein n=1 Tax=Aureimonas altamirensis TaxID=370622 RepID=UPI0020368A81|nr:saccharopine dehydrogenase NADP-binding domain-containing protein [Aureimonas altamirensis]MCM2503457.1 saccharopine dehydrogenase NADP-binding domain-containing protein [Aureimonas altamirensis]
MRDIVVIGAGKIGSAIAAMLAETGDYRVTVADRDAAAAAEAARHPNVDSIGTDIRNEAGLRALLKGRHAVLSAAPFHLTTAIAEAAAASGVHYMDLTEDVASTRRVMELARGSATAFIPQCGLAPGFISIVANDLAGRFDTLDTMRLRVGALPEFPSNALGYNLTWSTDGVINEYIEPCEAIVDGHKILVPAMQELETLSIDGTRYEAFNTSGGLGSLCETYAGKVRSLNYRTLRYPGHAAIMKTLLDDLGLRHRREVLKDILEHALPATRQDVVVTFATVTGMRNGRLVQETDARRIHSGPIAGEMHSAIQITTAAGICAVLDLLSAGILPQKGFVRQEDVPFDAFLANRFGSRYRRSSKADGASERLRDAA